MGRIHGGKHKEEMDGLARSATLLAISVSLVIASAKFFAWLHSGSLALLSSFADSLFDVTTSTINFLALRYAHKPADNEHRFGHGKAEAIASFTQGLVLIAVSLYIVVSGFFRLHEPHELADESLGLMVMVFSIIATAGLILYQRYVLRKTKSLIVKSDSLHYLGDLLTNAAVLASLVVSQYYRSNVTDSIIGIVIAMFMIYSAFTIIIEALNHLMDRELSDDEREKIMELVLHLENIDLIHVLT